MQPECIPRPTTHWLIAVLRFLSPFSGAGLSFFFSTKEKVQLLRSSRGWQAVVPWARAAFIMKTTTPTDLCLICVFFPYKKAIKHLSTLPIWATETVSYWWLVNFRTSIGLCTSTLHVPTSYLLPTNVYRNTFPLTENYVFFLLSCFHVDKFFLDQGAWALIKTILSLQLLTFPINPWSSFSQHIKSQVERRMDLVMGVLGHYERYLSILLNSFLNSNISSLFVYNSCLTFLILLYF